jgi:uncharacterized protein YndB with AHSA1/START domain
LNPGLRAEVVEVTRALSLPAAQVWNALTEPQQLSQWLGTLAAPLSVGERIQLNFDDGDYFVLDVLEIDPPATLKYDWRFLGIGPPDTITWNLTPTDGGCLLQVTDSESDRTPEAAALLRKGWLDFTERLEEFLRTGQPTRYAWRHECDMSVELAGHPEAVWELLLDPSAHKQWLPFSGPHFNDDVSFQINDGLEPSVFEVQAVELDAPRRVRFELLHQDWLHPTDYILELCPRAHDILLTVNHNGWEGISMESDYQKQQRMRFCNFWVKSLCLFTFEFVRRQAIPRIAPDELRARLDEPELFVFDCNPRSMWNQGHLPGATYAGQGAFAPALLPPDKSATLVFYCAGMY